METLKLIIAAASIPSAVVGLCFWWIQKKIEKGEKKTRGKRKTTGKIAVNRVGECEWGN